MIDVCDGIIILSSAAAGLLQREYRVGSRTRVQVIHDGHYMECYPNTISREAARECLGLQDRRWVVLSLGRLQPQKGLEELIEAFNAVGSPGDALILAVHSISDQYTQRLRDLALAHRCPGLRLEIHPEHVPDDEVQVYYNARDLVALPFRQVLNSGSLILAMSFGCPVVAPRLGSIPEVTCPQGWFGYEAVNPRGLAGALSEALATSASSDLRPQIRAFTAARYGWGSVGAQAVQLYRAILEYVAKRAGSGVRD